MRREGAGPSGRRRARLPCQDSALADVAGDPSNCTDDVAGEEREGTEHEGRDYGQNDPVLSHGLTLLALLQRDEELLHLFHLPSASRSAQLGYRRRHVNWKGGVRDVCRAALYRGESKRAHSEPFVDSFRRGRPAYGLSIARSSFCGGEGAIPRLVIPAAVPPF